MATKTRTITKAAVSSPSAGSEGLTSGPNCRGMGTVGTAVKEVSITGGRQIFLWSFKVGVRLLGQEQTVFPSFKVDMKVSGHAQVAVTELVEEYYISNLAVSAQCLKNYSTTLQHQSVPCDQADVGAGKVSAW